MIRKAARLRKKLERKQRAGEQAIAVWLKKYGT
jgi:hypothetical protein